METAPERRLHRSRRERMVAGVCGGLSEYFDVDPVIWRLAFVVVTFMGGAGVLIYFILAVLMPEEGREAAPAGDALQENVNDLTASARQFGDHLRGYAHSETTAEDLERRARNRQMGGLILVGVGALLLLGNLNLFWWFNWDRLWPVGLIIVGVAILVGQRRR